MEVPRKWKVLLLLALAQLLACIGAQHGEIGVEVDARIDGFALRVERMSALIAPAVAQLRGRIRWNADGVTVEPDRTRLDDLIVSGRVEVGFGADARVRVDLRVADFEPGLPAGPRLNPIRLDR